MKPLLSILPILSKKCKATDIAISQANHVFISEYDFYLRSVRGCNNNTTVKFIKNFNKIILICLASGHIVTNLFFISLDILLLLQIPCLMVCRNF
jgi:hypothetical protein